MELASIIENSLRDAPRIIGLFGFVLYVVGFAALQLRIIDGNNIAFSWINVLAAACVLISLTTEFNLPSALIQISWITLGLMGIAIRLKQRSTRAGSTIKYV